MDPSRRDVLVTIAALAAPAAKAEPPFLTPPELAFLTALADTIIPRTDTPGASDAGVPAAIERRLAASPQLAERFRAGRKALDDAAQSQFGAPWTALTAAQQIALLEARQDDPFFRLIKGMTIDAYYSSREGLSGELGWHGNTFLTEFKGCTHPEHQS
jgi:glucoside 3-dehydrogenase (cytochrome c) hitch-hiker subunit